MTLRTLTSLACSATFVLAFGACASEPAAPPTPADTSITAPSVLLRLAAIPEVFELAANDAEQLEFTAPSLPGPSTMTITLGDPEPGGLNILEHLEQQLDRFSELPEGVSFGWKQLSAPLGLTFLVRGRYQEGGREIEEFRAILVHPAGNRLLTMSYRYPASEDTVERGLQLMELLGEMEPLEQEQEQAP